MCKRNSPDLKNEANTGCVRNSPDKNEASAGYVRETPQIKKFKKKKKKKKKKPAWYVSEN